MTPYVEKVGPSQFPLLSLRPALPSLDFELTERCNNDCIHCCINQPADSSLRERELSTAEVKHILSEAADLGCLRVRFTGGEPLLRDDFDDLYLFARRLGMAVLLFTNARLITAARAALFGQVPPRLPIEITVYGMRQESYEAISRSPGSFSEFRRGVSHLSERKVPFALKTVLLPQNRSDLPSFEAWAADVNAVGHVMLTEVLDFRHRRDNPARNRLIASLRVPPEQVLATLTRDPQSYRADMKRFCSRFMRARGLELFACGACRNVCVDPYGRLQPCLPLRAPETAYDVREGSLRHALSQVFPLVRERRASHPDYLARCARCFLKGLCEQCPAKSWIETGALDAPVRYHCDIAHAQARYLGLLGAGETAWSVIDGRERIRQFASSC